MRFLCIGYFDRVRTAERSREEIAEVMGACRPHMEKLLAKKSVLIHAGLDTEATCIRRVGGKVSLTKRPFTDDAQRIGISFIVEANDMDEAVTIASVHPAIAVAAGEDLGWGIEVRPIDSLQGTIAD